MKIKVHKVQVTVVTCTFAMEMPKLQQVTEGYKSKCIKRTRKNNEN